MIDIATLKDQNKSGNTAGLSRFCTANEVALRAALLYAKNHQLPAVIETTCNQACGFI